MKSLYLAWQAPNRAWFPVGLLEADVPGHRYAYRYTKGALQAARDTGFKPLPAFPAFDRRYESSELFPLFRNRVLDANRKDFPDYLASLDLAPGDNDPIAILAVTGGERATDSLEVFPKIEKAPDNSFRCRFFLHGLRHLSAESQARATALGAEEPLRVSLELNNPATLFALQLSTAEYTFVGWTPRYLVGDLIHAIAERPWLTASVVRVNGPEVPLNRRVLVELKGRLPADVAPMTSEEFQPLVAA